MSRCHRFALIAASLAALAPHAVRAQKDVASCKPVLDAVSMQWSTPFHAYITRPATSPGHKPTQFEMIGSGGQHYILIDGQWNRSPMDQAAMAKQEEDNVRNAKALSCKRLRDESVGGEPAVVYAMHSETEDVKSDGQVWVAKRTGLVLRTETDVSMTGGSGTNHDSARYEYTNVHAPAGAK